MIMTNVIDITKPTAGTQINNASYKDILISNMGEGKTIESSKQTTHIKWSEMGNKWLPKLIYDYKSSSNSQSTAFYFFLFY